MVARALPVTTKLSQAGLGRAPPGEVMISTVCPLDSVEDRGARRRSILAATQVLPMSVCTA